MRLSIFHLLFVHLYAFFWKNDYSGPLPVLNELFVSLFDIVVYILYILDINLLLGISLANIFSNSGGYLFISFVVTFPLQNSFSLIWSYKESTMSSSRNVLDSGITFKSLIYYELIFVYDMRDFSSFILLHITVQFFQPHLLDLLDCILIHLLDCILAPFLEA